MKLIRDDGKRLDGREFDELRPVTIKAGTLERADGSAYVEMGENKVIAAVYGPRELHPRHNQDPMRAIIRFRYNMASFSVKERKRPGPDRRSIEISKVSREAIEPVVMCEYYPRTAIDVFVEILQSDAGTRAAGINAASVALADAGIPMKGLVSACAVGKVNDIIVSDLNGDEDEHGDADMPVAMIMPDHGEQKITLLQMDGCLTEDEFKRGLELAISGCETVYKHQRDALMERYKDNE